MPVSLQPHLDQITGHRRLFESHGPASNHHKRYVIKRSTTSDDESQKLNRAGTPERIVERSYSSLQNEALAIDYISIHTTIPVPNIVTTYEDRGCFVMIQEYVEGAIQAYDAPQHLHPIIIKQLEYHVEQMRRLRSPKLQCFTPQIHLPARLVANRTQLSHLEYPYDKEARYVLCHGDLGWQNILVDPNTGEIKCILDWEYAGFYPAEVVGEFWRRHGTADPLGSLDDDTEKTCEFLWNLSVKGKFDEDYPTVPHKEIDWTDRRYPLNKAVMDRAITSGGSGPRLSKVGKAVARVRRMLSGRSNTQSEDAGNSKENKYSGTSTQLPPDQSEQPAEVLPVTPPVSNTSPPKSVVNGDKDRQSDPCDAKEWKDFLQDHPKDTIVSSKTLTVQSAIASRKNLLKHIEALNTAFNIDYRITQNWSHATSSDLHAYHAMFHKNETLSHETLHLVELSRLINKAFTTLQEEMQKSVEPLEKFQANQFTSKIQLDRALKRWASRDENGEVASICSMSSFEDDQARKRYAKMHSDRDETFKVIETIKWAAISKYAENLLITAHAAEGLLPFTPDRVRNMPPSAHNSERKEAEVQARDLQLGGTGGFEIHVGKREDWIPIDPQERGVPEEDKFEGWKEMPDWVLKKIYKEDEDCVRAANHQ